MIGRTAIEHRTPQGVAFINDYDIYAISDAGKEQAYLHTEKGGAIIVNGSAREKFDALKARYEELWRQHDAELAAELGRVRRPVRRPDRLPQPWFWRILPAWLDRMLGITWRWAWSDHKRKT